MGSPDGGGGGGIFLGKSRPCLNLFWVCLIHTGLARRIKELTRFIVCEGVVDVFLKFADEILS